MKNLSLIPLLMSITIASFSKDTNTMLSEIMKTMDYLSKNAPLEFLETAIVSDIVTSTEYNMNDTKFEDFIFELEDKAHMAYQGALRAYTLLIESKRFN